MNEYLIKHYKLSFVGEIRKRVELISVLIKSHVHVKDNNRVGWRASSRFRKSMANQLINSGRRHDLKK